MVDGGNMSPVNEAQAAYPGKTNYVEKELKGLEKDIELGRVINQNILILEDDTAQQLDGGLVKSNSAGQRVDPVAMRGIVVKVADDFEDAETENEKKCKVQTGDIVLVQKFDAHQANLRTRAMLLIKQKDILYIFPESEKWR